MGSPQDVTAEQYKQLENEGQLALLDSPQWINMEGGATTINIELPRQAVSFIRVTW
jgi:xylan 1,4-beta-xylosidase